MASKLNKDNFAIAARLLIFAATATAAIVMSYSSDRSKTHSSCLAKYEIWTGFMYFRVLHIVACIYNFVVLFIPRGSGLWKVVVFIDLNWLVLLSTSWAAVLVSYIYLKNGNPHVGWPRVCNIVPEFCSKILGALITGGIGCAFTFVIFCFSLQHAVDYLLTDRAA